MIKEGSDFFQNAKFYPILVIFDQHVQFCMNSKFDAILQPVLCHPFILPPWSFYAILEWFLVMNSWSQCTKTPSRVVVAISCSQWQNDRWPRWTSILQNSSSPGGLVDTFVRFTLLLVISSWTRDGILSRWGGEREERPVSSTGWTPSSWSAFSVKRYRRFNWEREEALNTAAP